MSIDFLAVGNVTQDRVPGGYQLGGTVSYASVTALRLGRRPGILTRAACGALGLEVGGTTSSDPESPGLSGIEVCCLPSPVTTTFSNIYDDTGRRVQVVEAVAGPVEPAELPAGWAGVPLVLLGPIAGEVPAAWTFTFPHSLLGVMAQGFLRAWDSAGHVYPARWASAAPFLARADAVILSYEDVQGDGDYIGELANRTRLLVVTRSHEGCTVYQQGAGRRVAPRPARQIDPTGAGDVFTAAFLIRLAETADPLSAAHFANVAASMSIEGPGLAAIPYRAELDREL